MHRPRPTRGTSVLLWYEWYLNMTRYELSRANLNAGVYGSGRALLLIHGFPLNHRMWRNQINGLSDRYTVIAPDLRGFGESDISTGAMRMEDYADDLAELLDKMRVKEQIAICGLSMGGYVALEFIARHTERIAKIILCNTRADADSDEIARQRIRTAEELLVKGVETLASGMIPRLFSKTTLDRRRDTVDEVRQSILDASPVGVASALRGMANRTDFNDKLAGIDLPALVLGGSDDEITPPDSMQTLAASFPRAEYMEIADAGHLAPLERPAEVNAAMRQILW